MGVLGSRAIRRRYQRRYSRQVAVLLTSPLCRDDVTTQEERKRKWEKSEHAQQLINIVIHHLIQDDRDKQTVPMELTSFIAQLWREKYARNLIVD